MKKSGFVIGVVMVAMLVTAATEANAQSRHKMRLSNGRGVVTRTPVYGETGANGMTQNVYEGRVNILRNMKMAAHDNYSPHPMYAYSNRGLDAGRTHAANILQAQTTPWHGNYQNWRWRQPTALVVPPNSSYQTSYAWGVGQTRSNPLYHQFGRDSAGMGTEGAGGFSPTPYWPSSTEQFGLYPVRAPW